MIEFFLQLNQESQQLSLLTVGMPVGHTAHYVIQPRIHGCKNVDQDLYQVVHDPVVDKDLWKPGQLQKYISFIIQD